MAYTTRLRFLPSAAAIALTFALAPDALAEGPSVEPAAPPEIESPAMLYTGIALTTTGAVGLGVGTAVFFSMSGEGGDFAGLAATIVGGSILIPSSILVHIGIPLWAVGASERDRSRASAIPEVRVGASGGSLRWTF